MVYTWAFEGLLYHDFGVCVCTIMVVEPVGKGLSLLQRLKNSRTDCRTNSEKNKKKEHVIMCATGGIVKALAVQGHVVALLGSYWGRDDPGPYDFVQLTLSMKSERAGH